jgi:hypothetical protein
MTATLPGIVQFHATRDQPCASPWPCSGVQAGTRCGYLPGNGASPRPVCATCCDRIDAGEPAQPASDVAIPRPAAATRAVDQQELAEWVAAGATLGSHVAAELAEQSRVTQLQIIEELRAATTPDEVDHVRTRHASRWTPYLAEVAAARAADLTPPAEQHTPATVGSESTVADDEMPLPDLSRWAADATARGTDPQLVGKELIEAFRLGILAGDIRGRQAEIGPSGLGHPCARAIAYLLAGTPPAGVQDTPWRQAVGTAMHERGDLWAHLDNERRGTRWLTNLRVNVGELYPGRPITGTLDYLDVLTATVIDLKVPGATAMKTYGPGKPESPQYRVQLHAYGRGVLRAGFLPAHVAILRVSPARELADHIFKVEPFDEQVAVDALTRVGGIARMVDAIGPAAAAALPPTEHHCRRCDWFAPGHTDLTTGCPGAPGAIATRRDQLDDLVS